MLPTHSHKRLVVNHESLSELSHSMKAIFDFLTPTPLCGGTYITIAVCSFALFRATSATRELRRRLDSKATTGERELL